MRRPDAVRPADDPHVSTVARTSPGLVGFRVVVVDGFPSDESRRLAMPADMDAWAASVGRLSGLLVAVAMTEVLASVLVEECVWKVADPFDSVLAVDCDDLLDRLEDDELSRQTSENLLTADVVVVRQLGPAGASGRTLMRLRRLVRRRLKAGSLVAVSVAAPTRASAKAVVHEVLGGHIAAAVVRSWPPSEELGWPAA